MEEARRLSREAQKIPSRAPQDPNFRRLWYTRYADDFLLGLVETKAEAVEIKQKLAAFLRTELKLERSEDKTLVTHARDEVARFLGYEIHSLHADDKHDYRGQRSETVMRRVEGGDWKSASTGNLLVANPTAHAVSESRGEVVTLPLDSTRSNPLKHLKNGFVDLSGNSNLP